jgi:NAD(P)H-hydrate epimerase
MTTSALPVVTGEQMASVDRAMVEICGLELMQVMETAGRAVAIVTRRLRPANAPVVILCGSGGNGGDGFVCGRYLAGWGIPVELWLLRAREEYRGLAGHQLTVCRKIGMTVVEPDRPARFSHAGLIVDGLFGFGLSAPPVGHAAELIFAANRAGAPVLAIDLPSGVDATTGIAFDPAIRADLTLTLGLPKQGLILADGPGNAGEIVVADIGIPDAAYKAIGIPETDVFRNAEFVGIDGLPWRDG